ncbi:MAG: class I SAM-dependent methyltransferase [Candidatus Pacebacteria bacterium]|jgi:hypothetical protein|nr:class I SAM-dependent methyltransferase [Candidatus Paceibacterota bacterium]
MKTCNICGKEVEKIFTKRVLEKYDVDYFHCKNCHFIQTETPYWLDEAYKNSINKSDTGYVGRNILMSRITLVIFYTLFSAKDKFLDYAGGYGLFARLMNDYGLKFYWMDQYTEGIFATGLEYHNEEIKAVTCFECFEHFPAPVEEIKKILSISNTILFSTKLIPPNEIPDPDAWGYYGFHHGQHVAFYSEQSLRNLASKFGLHFYTDGKNIHIITNKKINNWLFKILVFAPKLQIEVILRKIIK